MSFFKSVFSKSVAVKNTGTAKMLPVELGSEDLAKVSGGISVDFSLFGYHQPQRAHAPAPWERPSFQPSFRH